MNIIEAVKSGKRFKRKHHRHWMAKYDGCLSERFRSSGLNEQIHHELIVNDILATDWEIEERKIEITESEFIDACRDIMMDWEGNHEKVIGPFGNALKKRLFEK